MLPEPIEPLKFFKLLTVVAIAIAVGACGTRKPGSNEVSPVASPPPLQRQNTQEMGWVLGDGTQSKMTDYQGKVLVLDFYATWCEPCRDSIPKLIELQKNYGPSGLQIVGLNVGGPDDRVMVRGFAHELGITYPLGFPDKALTDTFLPAGDYLIPQTFVFGRDGQLVKTFEGYDETVERDLEAAISEALNK